MCNTSKVADHFSTASSVDCQICTILNGALYSQLLKTKGESPWIWSPEKLRFVVRPVGLRAFWGIDSMRRTTAGTRSTEHNVSTLKRKQVSSSRTRLGLPFCLAEAQKLEKDFSWLVGYLSLGLFFDHRHSVKIRRFKYLNVSMYI